MKKLIVLFVFITCSVLAQPAPVFEATTNQVAAGVVGAPFYVSPRSLAGSGLGSPTNGQTAAQVQAIVANTNNNIVLPAINKKADTNAPTIFNPTFYSSNGSNAVYYVDPVNGSDANTGSSQWSAFQTISNAVNVTINPPGGNRTIKVIGTNFILSEIVLSNITIDYQGATLVMQNVSSDSDGFSITGNANLIGWGGQILATNAANLANSSGLFVPIRISHQANTNTQVNILGGRGMALTDFLLYNTSIAHTKKADLFIDGVDWVTKWDVVILRGETNSIVIRNSKFVAIVDHAMIDAASPGGYSYLDGITVSSGAGSAAITIENCVVKVVGQTNNFGIGLQNGAGTNFVFIKNTSVDCIPDATTTNLCRVGTKLSTGATRTAQATNIWCYGVWNTPDCDSNINWLQGSTTNAPITGGFFYSPDGSNAAWTLNGSGLTNLNGANISSGTIPTSAADTSWMPVTNAIAGTNQPMTAGQALVVVGTNTYGATMVKGTNWPSGGGISALYTTNDIMYDTNTVNGQAFKIDTNVVVHISTNGVDVITVGTNGLIVAVGNSNYFGGTVTVQSGVGSTRSNLLAPTALTFPATTVNWTNPINSSIMVTIDNSGVTGTALKKNGATISTSLTGDPIVGLQPGEFFSETYTIGTPTATWYPFP